MIQQGRQKGILERKEQKKKEGRTFTNYNNHRMEQQENEKQAEKERRKAGDSCYERFRFNI